MVSYNIVIIYYIFLFVIDIFMFISKMHKGANLLDIVKILVKTKIELHPVDNSGKTPQDYYKKRKFQNKIDVIKLLTKP